MSGYVAQYLHLPSNRPVAIKHVTKGSFFKQSHIDDALTEIAILRSIHHPNIIALLDWFETKDDICLVFEQASGGELFDRLEKLGHYTERDAACIAAVLCNALDYIHSRGVLHRDLKTHNMLFMSPEFDSRIVLVDFGISKKLMSPTDFTETIGMGTPSYTAPEVIEGLKYGTRCDDWSMGVIIHHLLSGYGPFDNCFDYSDILALHARGPQFDTEEWKFISADAKDFVKRMLTVRPSRRMTAGEALDHPWIKTMVPESYISQLRGINEQLLGIRRAVQEEKPADATAGQAATAPAPAASVPIAATGSFAVAIPGAAVQPPAPAAKIAISQPTPSFAAALTEISKTTDHAAAEDLANNLALKLSTSLSTSVPSPLAISQYLNQATANGQPLPDLIPHDLSTSYKLGTSPIPIKAGTFQSSTSSLPSSVVPTGSSPSDSLPDFTKADSNVVVGSFASTELPNLSTTMRRRREPSGTGATPVGSLTKNVVIPVPSVPASEASKVEESKEGAT